MRDQVIETIESSDGQRRVLIVRRADGLYSFRLQWREDTNYQGPGVLRWPPGYIAEPGWWPPGPYLGLYDGLETAIWEAHCRFDWLASALRPD
jgi:hypothetical protein